METKLICVYGSAKDRIDDAYKREVERLGRGMADRGYGLIFGGGAQGLMGAAARGVRAGGGTIVGVIPQFMGHYETLYTECTEFLKTETMAERKQVMEDRADAFVITPGGIGTYDEFFQVLTLRNLDRFVKPVIILNINGFFDDALPAIRHGIEQEFIDDDVPALYAVCETGDEALELLDAAFAPAHA